PVGVRQRVEQRVELPTSLLELVAHTRSDIALPHLWPRSRGRSSRARRAANGANDTAVQRRTHEEAQRPGARPLQKRVRQPRGRLMRLGSEGLEAIVIALRSDLITLAVEE